MHYAVVYRDIYPCSYCIIHHHLGGIMGLTASIKGFKGSVSGGLMRMNNKLTKNTTPIDKKKKVNRKKNKAARKARHRIFSDTARCPLGLASHTPHTRSAGRHSARSRTGNSAPHTPVG